MRGRRGGQSRWPNFSEQARQLSKGISRGSYRAVPHLQLGFYQRRARILAVACRERSDQGHCTQGSKYRKWERLDRCLPDANQKIEH